MSYYPLPRWRTRGYEIGAVSAAQAALTIAARVGKPGDYRVTPKGFPVGRAERRYKVGRDAIGWTAVLLL